MYIQPVRLTSMPRQIHKTMCLLCCAHILLSGCHLIVRTSRRVVQYLQVLQALFLTADEVCDLLILQGQGGGDLTKRFLNNIQKVIKPKNILERTLLHFHIGPSSQYAEYNISLRCLASRQHISSDS